MIGSSVVKFVFLIAITAGSTTIAQDVVVNLNSSDVKISDATVTLGHIAKVSGVKPDIAAAIQRLDLEILKNERDKAEITKRQIELRMLVSGLKINSIQLVGADKVRVERSSKFHPAQIINQAVINAISQQFNIETTDIRVSTTPGTSNAVLNEIANAIKTAIVILPDELPLGKAKVRFVYNDAQGLDKEYEFQCQVTILKEMLVARQNISRGKKLTSADVRLVRRPMSSNGLKPATLDQVIGKQTNKDILNHAVIQSSHLTTPKTGPAVKRNDYVDIVYKQNGVNILVLQNGKALKSGNVGDRIDVDHPKSSKPIVAVVVDNSTVEIR